MRPGSAGTVTLAVIGGMTTVMSLSPTMNLWG